MSEGEGKGEMEGFFSSVSSLPFVNKAVLNIRQSVFGGCFVSHVRVVSDPKCLV